MSPHVVDVAINDLGMIGPLAGLKAVEGPVVSLRIMARGVLSMGLISRLIPEMAVALYCAGKVPAKCAFSYVSFDFNPEVPAGFVRVVLLPAGLKDTPHPSPLPQGERETRDGGGLIAAPLPQGERARSAGGASGEVSA